MGNTNVLLFMSFASLYSKTIILMVSLFCSYLVFFIYSQVHKFMRSSTEDCQFPVIFIYFCFCHFCETGIYFQWDIWILRDSKFANKKAKKKKPCKQTSFYSHYKWSINFPTVKHKPGVLFLLTRSTTFCTDFDKICVIFSAYCLQWFKGSYVMLYFDTWYDVCCFTGEYRQSRLILI